MMPLPFHGDHALIANVVAFTLAFLLLLWVVPPVRWVGRAVWWVALRPRLAVPLLAVGLLTWLAWPILGQLNGIGDSVTPLVIVGALGALTCGLLVGRAVIGQRRIDADLDAQYADDDSDSDEPAPALPEWARE